MYSLNRKFIVLYNVDLLACSWNPHFFKLFVTHKTTLHLKALYYPTSTKRTTLAISANTLNCY